MKKLITIINLGLLASQIAFAGGEFGNEQVNPDGRPKSIANTPCEERFSWYEFDLKMRMENKDYASFLNMIREIYPPFYESLIIEGIKVNVCFTTNNINRSLPNLPQADPRVSLWLKEAEGSKNLLLIDTKIFFANKMTDAERAATIVRELLEPIFTAAKIENSDWMKWNLIHYIHEAYISNNPSSQYDNLAQMLFDYKLYDGDESELYFG
ncbi:MAG: hypothetical protein ABL927_06560, partial [Bdellovibrionales bacterium]